MATVKVKRKGRGVRKTSTITAPGATLSPGDIFTIDGCGVGKKGQKVVGGRNVATGRKCKTKALTLFKVTA
jgi:hypothetical protein